MIFTIIFYTLSTTIGLYFSPPFLKTEMNLLSKIMEEVDMNCQKYYKEVICFRTAKAKKEDKLDDRLFIILSIRANNEDREKK